MFYHLNLSVDSEQKHSVGGRIMPLSHSIILQMLGKDRVLLTNIYLFKETSKSTFYWIISILLLSWDGLMYWIPAYKAFRIPTQEQISKITSHLCDTGDTACKFYSGFTLSAFTTVQMSSKLPLKKSRG